MQKRTAKVEVYPAPVALFVLTKLVSVARALTPACFCDCETRQAELTQIIKWEHLSWLYPFLLLFLIYLPHNVSANIIIAAYIPAMITNVFLKME